MTEYDKVMAHAAQMCKATPYEKDHTYWLLRNALADMKLPIPYEKAIQELCKRLEY
jgi:hypothetical protein